MLAEEIGHHITQAKSSLLTSEQSLKEKSQVLVDEHKARIWAVKFLVPCNQFLEVSKIFNHSVDKLATYFRVTNEFIELRYLINSEW